MYIDKISNKQNGMKFNNWLNTNNIKIKIRRNILKKCCRFLSGPREHYIPNKKK